jgi:exodeoxyribonuclease III
MHLKLATWNINSVRLRIALVERFLIANQPDVLCLQETKSPDADFPHAAFTALGYQHQLIHGMKGYNGVAILSRLPLTMPTTHGWCGLEDCRHAHALLPGDVELHNFYIPSGGDIADPTVNPKFAHKLALLDESAAWFRAERAGGRRMILVGDLNIAPLENDVWSHKQLRDVVSHTAIEIAKLAALQAAGGFVDAVRYFTPEDQKLYSWWSYRGRDWAGSNRGRRLDHIWVTQPLVAGLVSAEIRTETRGWIGPSDHVPVILDLEI